MKRPFVTAIAAALAGILLAGSAAAQQSCTRNGQTYADGTRIGDLKCENGRWVVVQ